MRHIATGQMRKLPQGMFHCVNGGNANLLLWKARHFQWSVAHFSRPRSPNSNVDRQDFPILVQIQNRASGKIWAQDERIPSDGTPSVRQFAMGTLAVLLVCFPS